MQDGELEASETQTPGASDAARIEAGGIPLATEQRLRALGLDGATFNSGLSVNEFALLHKLGPKPLAQVMGASVYRVGRQYLPAMPARSGWSGFANPEPTSGEKSEYLWHQTVICELDTIAQAWDRARRAALDRLREEAIQVGADAVAGVHLRRGEHDLGAHTIDFAVSGTAIRWRSERERGFPMLSDLSVEDFWRLLEHDHEPVGLLATTGVVFVSASRSTRMHRTGSFTRNQEIEELSRAFFLARDSVRATLRGQVDAQNGVGAVGISFSHTIERDSFALESTTQQYGSVGWREGQLGMPSYRSGASDTEREGWVITMHGTGTAIRRRGDEEAATPNVVLRLRDRPREDLRGAGSRGGKLGSSPS